VKIKVYINSKAPHSLKLGAKNKKKGVNMIEVRTRTGAFCGRYRKKERAEKVKDWLEKKGVEAILVKIS